MNGLLTTMRSGDVIRVNGKQYSALTRMIVLQQTGGKIVKKHYDSDALTLQAIVIPSLRQATKTNQYSYDNLPKIDMRGRIEVNKNGNR